MLGAFANFLECLPKLHRIVFGRRDLFQRRQSWEILRYRQLKQRIIEMYCEQLKPFYCGWIALDCRGRVPENCNLISKEMSPIGAMIPRRRRRSRSRLLQHDFDDEAVSAEAYCQAKRPRLF
jgi:hypothetical protein